MDYTRCLVLQELEAGSGGGSVGVESDCGCEDLFSLFEQPGPEISGAQGHVGGGEVRLQVDGLFERGDGAGKIASLSVDLAEDRVCRGVARDEPDRPSQMGNRLLGLSG